MKALDKKLLRDLSKMKGQALAIALVIASGVATYVLLIATMDSLNKTREEFYRKEGFADVFLSLKRAPESLKRQIAELPGVEKVETRVSADVKLDIDGFDDPVSARIISAPEEGQPLLNKVYIRRGRYIDPAGDDEVLVSEAFAEAHGLSPGDAFGAAINGKWKRLSIAGTALSPEFILQVMPGALSPDYKRYAILWMGRGALGSAYDMNGAFNDVVISLSEGAREADVISALDALFSPYGGLGAYGRKDQMSNRFLSEEFKQLQRSAEIFPPLFIGVAAFLLNVVIGRIIGTEREQIAALKAFGYSNRAIGLHYVKMVLAILAAGVSGGIALGVWLGKGLGMIYMDFYRFPYLMYEVRPSVALSAASVCVLAALAGTLGSVRRAAALPPAEAMRPEAPARYRRTLIDRIRLGRLLSQPARIILRNISRRPVKALISITGISFACAIMIAGMFSKDAVNFMVDVEFKASRKEDMAVAFTAPTSRRAVNELKGLNGVWQAEAYREVPVRLRAGHRTHRTVIKGVEPGGGLRLILDTDLRAVPVPPSGIVLSDYLAGMLGLRPGQYVTVEALEGARPALEVQVSGLAKQYIGAIAYMDIRELNRLMKEGSALSGAYLKVNPVFHKEVLDALRDMPRVSGAVLRKEEVRNFYETQAEALLFFTFIATVLAGTIAFGVVYNSARISLSERGRELASLRVLGYTRAEISYIFLGELAVLAVLSIPLGFLIGRGICEYMAKAFETDLFRIPVVIEPFTYSFSAAVVLVSAALSGLIVRYRLDHLDLVSALKSKE